jgi:hypothetical protein
MRHHGRLLLVRVGTPALVALMVMACSRGGEPAAEPEAQDGPTTPAASATAASAQVESAAPSPASTAATPEEYQQVLTQIDERLAERFEEVSKVRSPVGLPDALATLRRQVDEGRAALAEIVPPEAVGRAHDELDAALSGLSADVSTVENAAASNLVCAGSAAVRRIGNNDGAAAVRAAGAGLAESDPVEEYTVGTFVPEPGKQRHRRGQNGDLEPGRRSGLGVMRITGSPESDSLIKLRIKKRGIRNVYVRSDSTVEVNDLPDGRYAIFIAQGTDWDGRSNRFTRQCSFSRLDGTFEFTTTETQYTVWELELLESVLGNAPSSPVDPGDFPN